MANKRAKVKVKFVFINKHIYRDREDVLEYPAGTTQETIDADWALWVSKHLHGGAYFLNE